MEERLRNLLLVQLQSGFVKKAKGRQIEMASKTSKDENQIRRMNAKGTLDEAVKFFAHEMCVVRLVIA